MDINRFKNGDDKKEGDAIPQNSSLPRRKKKNHRSRPSSGYLQEWVHQSRSFVPMPPAPHYDPQYSPLVGPYWEVTGSPRMFAAFSDPSVCRYSVPTAPPPPLTYSFEPVSLPIYQPAFQTAVPSNHVGPWQSPQRNPNRSAMKPEALSQGSKQALSSVSSKRSSKFCTPRRPVTHSPPSNKPLLHGTSPQEEYLSLPPGTHQGCDLDDSHRRFSDPGLARSESDSVPVINVNNNNINNNQEEDQESGDWSQSGTSSSESANYKTVQLSEQLNLLKADNKRLAQELRDTRAELHRLKLQAAAWGNPVQRDYQPGMIADLVREIRDAAQLREETLVSRLRLMMADGGVLRLAGGNSLEKESFRSAHIRDPNMSTQDSSSSSDHRDLDRIARLERQLNHLQIHNGHGGGETSHREDQLRRELLEAQAARRMAEGNVHKLENLMNMMRKKMNGVTGREDEQDADQQSPAELVHVAVAAGSPAPSSLESLTSATSVYSSNHGVGPAFSSTTQGLVLPGPPGPVTDL